MLYVEIWGLDGNGDPAVSGTIGWDGRQYVLNPPDSVQLQNVLASPVHVPGSPKTVLSSDPEEFLHCLELQYHGSYMWASPAKHTDAQPA